MTVVGPLDLLVAVLLVFVRIVTFLNFAPPFNSKSIPVRVRVLLSFALAIAIGPMHAGQVVGIETLQLFPAVLFQILCGFTIGFLAYVLLAAVQAAGELIDLFSSFAMASMLDPFSNTNSSIFGRIQNLIGITLLFSSGAHLVILRGMLTTFELMPVGTPDLQRVAAIAATDVARLAWAAVEISGPILACLFLADLALGMVSRAVPSLNIFQLSFPVKTMLTVSLSTIAVSMLPMAVSRLVDQAVSQFQPTLSFLGG